MNKQKWLNAALNKGFESFEIYRSLTKQKKVTWFQGQMDTFVSSSVLGTSVRGIYQGKMANFALEQTKDDQIDFVLNSLIDQAKTVSSQEVDILRNPQPVTLSVSASHWTKPSMEQLETLFKTLEEKILAYDPRIMQVPELLWQEAKGSREITNTLGIDLEDHDQYQILLVSALASENGQAKQEYEIEIVHDPAKLDLDVLVKKVCDKVLLSLNSASIPSQKTSVILEKEAMTSLLAAFMGLFSGELIYKGISPLKGKEGTAIFSDKITLIDDPTYKDAFSQAFFDDEGCPTCRKVLVDHGVFHSMLHDTKSALRMGCESSGNGFKQGYASPISVMPMNAYIESGESSLEELCMQMKDGLVITSLEGLHAGINFVTTRFSLQCTGYMVKDGKRAQSVSLITIADSFLELMNKVVALGNDIDWSTNQIASPSILFKDCAISGE